MKCFDFHLAAPPIRVQKRYMQALQQKLSSQPRQHGPTAGQPGGGAEIILFVTSQEIFWSLSGFQLLTDLKAPDW